jgi:hypothetical protein
LCLGYFQLNDCHSQAFCRKLEQRKSVVGGVLGRVRRCHCRCHNRCDSGYRIDICLLEAHHRVDDGDETFPQSRLVIA